MNIKSQFTQIHFQIFKLLSNLSIYLSIYISIYLSNSISIYLSIHLTIYLSIYLLIVRSCLLFDPLLLLLTQVVNIYSYISMYNVQCTFYNLENFFLKIFIFLTLISFFLDVWNNIYFIFPLLFILLVVYK